MDYESIRRVCEYEICESFLQNMHSIYILTSSGIVSWHGEDRSLRCLVHQKRVICMGNGLERADK